MTKKSIRLVLIGVFFGLILCVVLPYIPTFTILTSIVGTASGVITFWCFWDWEKK